MINDPNDGIVIINDHNDGIVIHNDNIAIINHDLLQLSVKQPAQHIIDVNDGYGSKQNSYNHMYSNVVYFIKYVDH